MNKKNQTKFKIKKYKHQNKSIEINNNKKSGIF